MKGLKLILSMAVLLSLASCASTQAGKQKVLRHVVAFEFKEEVTEERRAQAVKDFVGLKDEIPEIIRFEGGEDISVEGLSQGFTHCYIITFGSVEDRDIYIPHPAHLALAEKNKPLMKNLIVIDMWGEE